MNRVLLQRDETPRYVERSILGAQKFTMDGEIRYQIGGDFFD
jgi:hypothetical protein